MLEWLQSTTLAVWVGESPSVWALPTILTLHTSGLAILVGASWVLDLRLLGISRTVPLPAFRWVFPVVGVGLVVNVVTGLLLFIKNATTLGTAIPFLIKMLLVIVGVATLLPLRSHVLRVSRTERRDGVASPPHEGRRVHLLAIASILVWAGAVTAGRLLAYLIQ